MGYATITVRRRTALLQLTAALGASLVAAGAKAVPSSQAQGVTLYGADWCGHCKALERTLRERDIPFTLVDVDKSPEAHERAKRATGTSAIPVTEVANGNGSVWIVGNDPDAVERAYRGR